MSQVAESLVHHAKRIGQLPPRKKHPNTPTPSGSQPAGSSADPGPALASLGSRRAWRGRMAAGRQAWPRLQAASLPQMARPAPRSRPRRATGGCVAREVRSAPHASLPRDPACPGQPRVSQVGGILMAGDEATSPGQVGSGHWCPATLDGDATWRGTAYVLSGERTSRWTASQSLGDGPGLPAARRVGGRHFSLGIKARPGRSLDQTHRGPRVPGLAARTGHRGPGREAAAARSCPLGTNETGRRACGPPAVSRPHQRPPGPLPASERTRGGSCGGSWETRRHRSPGCRLRCSDSGLSDRNIKREQKLKGRPTSARNFSNKALTA